MAFSPLRTLLGAALLATMAVPASAQVGFDPVDEVLGTLGITGRARPHIEYRERAPLVVPPSGARLRAPEERTAVRGQRWPNDPDVAARRRAFEEGRAPATTDREEKDFYVRDGAKSRNRYAGVPNRGGGTDDSNPAMAVTPDVLRRLQTAEAAENRPAGGEPRREVLTDPPNGYRRATAKVKATIEPMRTGDDIQINVNQPRY